MRSQLLYLGNLRGYITLLQRAQTKAEFNSCFVEYMENLDQVTQFTSFEHPLFFLSQDAALKQLLVQSPQQFDVANVKRLLFGVFAPRGSYFPQLLIHFEHLLNRTKFVDQLTNEELAELLSKFAENKQLFDKLHQSLIFERLIDVCQDRLQKRQIDDDFDKNIAILSQALEEFRHGYNVTKHAKNTQ